MPVLVLLSIFCLFLLKGALGAYERYLASLALWQKTHNELESLKQRQGSLQSDVDRLKTERGVEAELRSKFQVAKPGENLIIIVDEDKGTGGSASSSAKSLWQRFLEIF